ncbi:DMT family transporter [uncultured Maritimibacter sp.]|uniref:DMT family transporter n=1 Tax=uncultured Maritimibacter sp. TaxID=991866 RepID=UPI002595FF8B|nr:DMT family transporter [uncultured Maritimibacter sp.]
MTTPRITPASWAMFTTLAVVWGSTFLIVEIALRGVGPGWVSAARVVFAAILMLAVWAANGFRLFESKPTRGDWGLLIFVCLLSATFPFLLLPWGQQYVTSAFAGVTMASMIFIVLPMAHFMVPGERMRLRSTIGFLIGFAGVVILIGGETLTAQSDPMALWGGLAVFGTAVCYGVGSIYMRRLPPIDPLGLSAMIMIVGAVGTVPVAFALDGPPPMPDRTTFIALAVLGLIPTAAANFLRTVLIRSAGPTFLSLVNYIVPLVSVALGAALLNEALPPTMLLALVAILSGMAISQWEGLVRMAQRLRA